MQAIAGEYDRWRADHSQDTPPETLKANAGAFAGSAPARQLPELLKPVKQQAEEATAKVNSILRAARVSDDNVSQVKAQRFWARTQRTLDAIKDPAKLVKAAQDLVANAEDSDIPTIAEELTDYMASRGVAAGWIPAALATKIPGLADAQTEAILAHRQHAVLLQNCNLLRDAMAKDVAAPPLMDPSLVTAEPYTETSTD